ncbi:MAG TPA: NADH-quinone oxidoreductase subunit C [Holophagaceae bacterium]|jgi:NADH-quinone oxidoreductase subunit C|nr:NADH-quinone oxidoreductase subunit C [Holophagaceae bacterium]
MAITKVWIEDGCIVCNACEAECADVFHVTAETCMIRGESRQDGTEDENRAAKNPLKVEVGTSLEASIKAAAAGCPVSVIKFEEVASAKPAAANDVDAAVDKALGAVPEAAASAADVAPDEGGLPATTGYVWDIKTAPNREVVMPKSAPLPSYKAFVAEQEAAKVADEAKWQKQLADFETAKAKALAEEKPEPKAPVRAVPAKNETDMVFPAPTEAQAPELKRLMEVLGDKVEEAFEQAGEMTCQVKKEAILEALRLCKDDAALKFEMLADETATHYPAAEGYAFSVVYHLASVSRSRRLRLRILVPEGFEPESAEQVYPTANWLEREIFDMLGIRFANHTHLTRILCPDGWEGHALRKEYPTLGLGQREISFREDRSGMLMKLAMEAAGNLGINLTVPKAD